MNSEIRNSKFEGIPKSETRNLAGPAPADRASDFGFVSDFGFRISVFYWLCFGALASSVLAGDLNPPSTAPFLRLRETTLGYHGSQSDFTNLTEIRLGWFGPTNLADPLTGDLWWAANQAIREANESAAVLRTSSFEFQTSDFGFRASDLSRVPFRLVPRWAVDPWGSGVSQLARMVYDEQPLALLSPVDSGSTHLAEQVVAKANLPLISPSVTDKSVTLAGVSWMFSCAPSDAVIARVLVTEILTALSSPQNLLLGNTRCESVLAEKSEFRIPNSEIVPSWLTSKAAPQSPRLALLTCTDHDSRMITREVLKAFSRRGRLPDYHFEAPPGAHDIARQLSALEEARPAAMLIIAGAEDSARLVRAVRGVAPPGFGVRPSSGAFQVTNETQKAAEDSRTPGRSRADFKPALSSCAVFGAHSMSRTRFRELAGSAAEGVCFPLLFVPERADVTTSRFIEQFSQARGHAPDYAAALTYDATGLLIEAIRRAGPNRARIRETLTQLSPWPGIAGPIYFDGTGQNPRTNVCLGAVRDGAVVPLTAPSKPACTASNNPSP